MLVDPLKGINRQHQTGARPENLIQGNDPSQRSLLSTRKPIRSCGRAQRAWSKKPKLRSWRNDTSATSYFIVVALHCSGIRACPTLDGFEPWGLLGQPASCTALVPWIEENKLFLRAGRSSACIIGCWRAQRDPNSRPFVAHSACVKASRKRRRLLASSAGSSKPDIRCCAPCVQTRW